MIRPISRLLLTMMFVPACASDADIASSQTALACFHTDTSVLCARNTDEPDATVRERLRQRVEDFYPSACLDGDGDSDGIPDFLDIDFANPEAVDAAEEATELRCGKCNRGPGTQNDFRLTSDGSETELERGKVFAIDGDTLTVPMPEGLLTIRVNDTTQYEDGQPSPGAEIRVRGAGDETGALAADRLKVLCPAPGAVPDDAVPPEAEPVEPGGEGAELPPIIVR